MENWKIYIWKRVEEATYEYHSEGGIVVIAKSEIRAREIANNIDDCNIREDEEVDYVYNISKDENYRLSEKMFIFPDAGCC